MDIDLLSKQLNSLLYGSGKTVCTAESCTGGAISAAIVSQSGASDYFKGGIVSYCNEVKESLLGVSRRTLDCQTAVSEDVARQMARGAMQRLGADYAVAVTGCAGPGGGTKEIPVGTIWLCCSGRDPGGGVEKTLCLREDLGREANLRAAVVQALELLIEAISLSRA